MSQKSVQWEPNCFLRTDRQMILISANVPKNVHRCRAHCHTPAHFHSSVQRQFNLYHYTAHSPPSFPPCVPVRPLWAPSWWVLQRWPLQYRCLLLLPQPLYLPSAPSESHTAVAPLINNTLYIGVKWYFLQLSLPYTHACVFRTVTTACCQCSVVADAIEIWIRVPRVWKYPVFKVQSQRHK